MRHVMKYAAVACAALLNLPAFAQVTGADVPRYQVFVPPPGVAEGTNGEFNIGFNPKTGRIMAFASANTFRVTPPEKLNPPLPESADALWEDVSPFVTSQLVGLDPILWTDQATGRTLTSNFTGGANLEYAYSDDDGDTWMQAGIAPLDGGVDHETIGTGPYPAGSPFAVLSQAVGFGNATYYCSQADLPAFCQRSDDGGLSYGPGVPIYTGITGDDCSSLHGHVHVAPDGTVYVPSATGCSGVQGGAVSTDAGTSWNEFEVPGTVANNGMGSDPSVGIDADSTSYYCYVNNELNGGGHVRVAVSRDRGQTWTDDTDIGLPFNIVNAAFPEATVGGDSGRVSCGFLGTDTPGDWQDINTFHGVWHLYIATTYDGGKTWTTVDVTPNDPVQGWGGIWLGGGGNQNRNLLDFNEVTIDDRGRVLFGFDKGCVGECVSDPSKNTFVADLRIARQTGGKTLFAKFDPTGSAVPAMPYLTGTRDDAGAHLAWKAPDSGGAEIQSYKVYRAPEDGDSKMIAQVSTLSYDDASADPATAYTYEVAAVNAQGDGVMSNPLSLAATKAGVLGISHGRFGGALGLMLLAPLLLGRMLRRRPR